MKVGISALFSVQYTIFVHMIHITRRERFSSAHKLYRSDWSDEKNLETFGKCSNPNWHGHNYELFVTVKGDINPETGFLIDLRVLKQIILEEVIEKLDHRNVNLDVDFMQGKMASTEVMAVEIFNLLAPRIQAEGAILHSVKLCETENNFIEYFGK